MLRSLIEQHYQALFNYFVKKDGYSGLAYISTGFLLFIIFVFALATLALIINLFFDNILSHKNQSKGLFFLGMLIFAVLNHIFLFHVLKLEKTGNFNDHLFVIEPTKYKKALRTIFSPLIVFSVVLIISLIFQYVKELEK